jgi:predicted permease
MKLAAHLRSLWSKFFRHSQVEQEMAEELRSHVQHRADDLERSGLPRTEAERQARIEFGGYEKYRQESYEALGGNLIETLLQDVRFSLRILRKSPGFAAVAVLSLALGIGATTSMFSLIYAVLLHPVPYAGGQRLTYPAYFNDDQSGSPLRWFSLNWMQYQQLLKARSLEDAVGSQNMSGEITGHDLPEDVSVTYVTENIGNFVQVTPVLGRNLQPSDADVVNQQAPVVLDYNFWMRHYNGDHDVLGRVLEIDHKPYTIVGVMPKNYTWWPDVYVPMSLLPERDRNVLPVMKLRRGVSLAMANAEIGALLHPFAKETPKAFPEHFRMHLQHISDRILDSMGYALDLLFAAVVVLLIIGCANCSILLLARGMARQNELAVRTALGASRYRIVRQLLIETLTLAVTGSLLGIVLAFWLAKLIFSLFPDVFMHESVIEINLPILVFSILLAVLSGVLFGLVPSLRMSRTDVSQMMQATVYKIAGRPSQTKSLNALIVSQIALTIVIMGAAGFAMGSFMQLMHRNLGYDPSHVMAVPVPFHRDALLTREQRSSYIETLRQKIATVPGVIHVAVSSNGTPPNNGWRLPFEISGMPFASQQRLRVNFVGSGYFSTLRIPLLQGRLWDERENARGAAVAVINQTFARQYFPKGDSIGQQVRLSTLEIPSNGSETVGVPDVSGWLQIIGVAADSLNDGPDRPIQPALYMPYTRFMWMGTQFLVRTQGVPLAALRDVRVAIQSVNPDQPTAQNVRDLQELMEQEPAWRQQRMFSILFGVFSGLALALALIGLYSVISYSVAQRTNEFGIRMALGAQRWHVLLLVVRSIGITIGSGLVAGLFITLALQKFMARWINSTSHNPLILVAVALLFLMSAAGACLIPALRATSIDPVQALRYE